MQINRNKHNTFVVPNTGVTPVSTSTSQSTTEDTTTQTTTSNLPVIGINSGGIMSTAEQDKLDGIEEGAQVNQEAFSYISVNGTDTITAQEEMSTFGITAGENITLTVSEDVIIISCPNTETLAAIEVLTSNLAELTAKVSSLESSISSLQSSVSSIENSITDLEDRVTVLEDSASSSQ